MQGVGAGIHSYLSVLHLRSVRSPGVGLMPVNDSVRARAAVVGAVSLGRRVVKTLGNACPLVLGRTEFKLVGPKLR